MEDAGNAADTLEDAVASNQQAGKPGLENSAGQNLGKLQKYTKTDVNRSAEDSGFDVTSDRMEGRKKNDLDAQGT